MQITVKNYEPFFSLLKKIYLFTLIFWLRWAFVAAPGLTLVVANGHILCGSELLILESTSIRNSVVALYALSNCGTGAYLLCSGQVSRSSAGEYQADERAGVARISWRVSGR